MSVRNASFETDSAFPNSGAPSFFSSKKVSISSPRSKLYLTSCYIVNQFLPRDLEAVPDLTHVIK